MEDKRHTGDEFMIFCNRESIVLVALCHPLVEFVQSVQQAMVQRTGSAFVFCLPWYDFDYYVYS